MFSQSMMNDLDDDPFFGAHFRQMRQMNSMMSSMFSDPFAMMGDMGGMGGMGGLGAIGGMGGMGGPLSIMAPHHHPRNAMMPFMPHMNMNRLLTGMSRPPGHDLQQPVWAMSQLPAAQAVSPYSGGLDNGRCNSFSSSTVVMSNGPDGRPQVYSATSSTQLGPGGVKETRRTVQDSRTGTKKMSIGHHINDRGHVVEREQNVRSGDLEEREEFINIEEEEAEDFTREFGQRLQGGSASGRPRQLALLPSPAAAAPPSNSSSSSRREIAARRPLRHMSSSPLALSSPHSHSSAAVRQTYGSLHPQRTKQRNPKSHHNNPDY